MPPVTISVDRRGRILAACGEAVVAEAAARTDRSGLVFPGAGRGHPLSENTHAKLLRELGFDSVTHGFRSSFRDWAAEQTHTPHTVMEAALAHTIKNKAEAAHARSDLRETPGVDGGMGRAPCNGRRWRTELSMTCRDSYSVFESSAWQGKMTDRSKGNKGSEHRIFVGGKGHRYVKAEELLRDPNVQRRLQGADRLASRLGLKGKLDD